MINLYMEHFLLSHKKINGPAVKFCKSVFFVCVVINNSVPNE